MEELKEQLQYAITHSEEPEKVKSYLEAINELEKNRNEIYEAFKTTTEELCEYAKRNEETIEYIKNKFCNNNDLNDCWHEEMNEILSILKGDEINGEND